MRGTRGHASVSLYTKLHAVFNRLDEATDAESHIKGTPSGRLAGFGIEQFMAEEGENVLQLKQLPKTKAAVAGVQQKLIAILSVCTGSDVVRESQDADEDCGASAAPRKSDDIETGAEAAPTEEGARLGGEEEGEEPQREGRKCLPCGGARKEQPEAAAAAAEGEGEPAQ